MPHPIEIKASNPESGIPDELLIFWGNTPSSSTATLYLPSVPASEVIRLANGAFQTHQLIANRRSHCAVSGWRRHYRSDSERYGTECRAAFSRIAAGDS